MGRRKSIPDDELLQHAREVFLESGASGSTKEIARRAGVAEATLFQRYPTKAALFVAALVPPKADVHQIVNAPTEQTTLPGALTEIGVRMLEYFRTLIPSVMHLVSHPSITIADVTAHFESAPEKALAEALAEYLRKAAVSGEARVENPQAAASLLVAAVHSLAVFELIEIHGGHRLEHAIPAFVDALWSGLQPETEAVLAIRKGNGTRNVRSSRE